MIKICRYKYCDKDIFGKILQVRYCCVKHRNHQHALNKTKCYFIKEKMKIKKRKRVIIKNPIPTIITPQASRYQDLLRYSTTVMSKFK